MRMGSLWLLDKTKAPFLCEMGLYHQGYTLSKS